jgi:hypothetical protein
MVKKRFFSVHDDFNTGFLSKCFIVFGALLLALAVLFSLISFFLTDQSSGILSFFSGVIDSGFIDISFALAIIFIGIGFILWFLHRQFYKLADIAEDIEKIQNQDQ